jgi:tRNA G26 N,N-dimethylase Trm1
MEKKELEIVHESNLMIDEGAARIIIGKKIFYNPIQEFNRDLT